MSVWTNEEFDGLERTLHNCMSLIDFAHVSSHDFYDKIWPFRRMLPNTLLEDIVRYSTLVCYSLGQEMMEYVTLRY